MLTYLVPDTIELTRITRSTYEKCKTNIRQNTNYASTHVDVEQMTAARTKQYEES